MRGRSPLQLAVLIAAASLPVASAGAIELTITIENLAPRYGVHLTPTWVSFHNGDFDLFDLGQPASVALERLAEDGDTSEVAGLFLGSGSGAFESTISGPGGTYAPGDIQEFRVDIDAMSPMSRYFSFASMVIPSNDAFIANGNPMAHQIFDDQGDFLGLSIFILGSMVLDAGTELNTEAPQDTAFFGQQSPNTGPDENGVIHIHPGYKRRGMGGILDSPPFRNADFIVPGYPIAQILITPEPGSAALMLIGGIALLKRRAV